MTDPFFRMQVEDVFSIKGRGTVVTGRIDGGTLSLGDEILDVLANLRGDGPLGQDVAAAE